MNIIELLGLKTTLISAEKTIVSVSVSDKLMQPYGIVHGGVNALLAETAAYSCWRRYSNTPSQNRVCRPSYRYCRAYQYRS